MVGFKLNMALRPEMTTPLLEGELELELLIRSPIASPESMLAVCDDVRPVWFVV